MFLHRHHCCMTFAFYLLPARLLWKVLKSQPCVVMKGTATPPSQGLAPPTGLLLPNEQRVIRLEQSFFYKGSCKQRANFQAFWVNVSQGAEQNIQILNLVERGTLIGKRMDGKQTSSEIILKSWLRNPQESHFSCHRLPEPKHREGLKDDSVPIAPSRSTFSSDWQLILPEEDGIRKRRPWTVLQGNLRSMNCQQAKVLIKRLMELGQYLHWALGNHP